MERTAGAERAVHGVERDVVHGVNERLVFRVGCTIAPVALEREVLSVHTISYIQFRQHDLRTDGRAFWTYVGSLSSTYLYSAERKVSAVRKQIGRD